MWKRSNSNELLLPWKAKLSKLLSIFQRSTGIIPKIEINKEILKFFVKTKLLFQTTKATNNVIPNR